MKRKDLFSGAFLCILFATAFVMALGFPAKSKEFPIFLTVSGFVLSVVLLFRGIRAEKSADNSGSGQKNASPKSRRNIVFTFLALVLYAVSIPNIGFCVSTFAYLVGSMCFLYPEKKTARNYVVIVGVSLIFVVFLFVVFKQLLYVPLPEGLLI